MPRNKIRSYTELKSQPRYPPTLTEISHRDLQGLSPSSQFWRSPAGCVICAPWSSLLLSSPLAHLLQPPWLLLFSKHAHLRVLWLVCLSVFFFKLNKKNVHGYRYFASVYAGTRCISGADRGQKRAPEPLKQVKDSCELPYRS